MFKKILLIIPLLLFSNFSLGQDGKNYILSKLTIQTSMKNSAHRNTKGLIPFKVGQSLTRKDIENLVNRITNLELIKKIDYTIENLDANNIALDFYIHEYRTVRGISVKGNYPFLAKEIRRLIPLQPGTIFEEKTLKESEDAIHRFLEKNGYYNSEVKITYKTHDKYPVVDLNIEMKRGYFYRVGDINIIGNTVFYENRIKNKISKSSRFQEKKLKKDIKKIRSLYQNAGYIKARVKVTKKEFDQENKKVHLTIEIRENKKLELNFSGNKVFSPARLHEVSNLSQRRTYDRYAIDRARLRIEKYYQKNGYPYVQIESSIEKKNDKVYVNFIIEAGQRVELSHIEFVGNKEISDGKLEKIILSKESAFFSPGIYNETLLKKDRILIHQEYLKEGFFEAKISEPEAEENAFGDKRVAKFFIEEGKPYEIKEVIFYGLPDESLLFAKKLPLRRGVVFNQELFAQTKDRILKNLFELGYAYADMETEIEKYPETRSLDLIYKVSAGIKTKVRNIIIKGNFKTKPSVIHQNLTFKSGDLFNYQKALNSQLNLRKLGIFRTVRVQPLGFDEKLTNIDVLVQVVERPTLTTNFQIGYDNRSSIRGEIDITKRNFLGLAKQINTRIIGAINFSRFETTFSAPRIFGADINLANQYFAEYENGPIYNAVSYGGYVSAFKTLSPRWTLGVRNQVTRTEVIESESDIASLGSSLFDNTLNEFRVFTYFDARDNFADPNKGVYVYANNELNTELSNLENIFTTVELGISHHKKLFGRFTFNHTFRYGQIFALTNSANVPFNELFYMGGSDTLRGFNEDSVNTSGGTLRLIYNAEIHYRLFDAFKLATFFDVGFLGNNWNDFKGEDVRESAGFGLRYFTPVGPIRLDYGFILDQRNNEPDSRLHFSFGYFF